MGVCIRFMWISVGILSFALGFIGVLLPLLPTTPFLLFSVFCFSKSSPRLHNWILNNRLFGKYIKCWEKNHSIPLKGKIFAVVMIIASTGYTALYFIPYVIVQIVFVIFAVILVIYIITRPTAT